MKKLKLQRETISILTSSELERARGGDITVSIVIQTNRCPVLSNGCTGSVCVQTTGTSGTSVIYPGG
jgi:hypothetical protein